jgi:hypothetical protein
VLCDEAPLASLLHLKLADELHARGAGGSQGLLFDDFIADKYL